MKHAGADTLAELDDVLAAVRRHRLFKERKTGAFYFKSSGFLHFHEDPAGIFADVKLDGKTFSRMRASTKMERSALVRAVDGFVARVSERATAPSRR